MSLTRVISQSLARPGTELVTGTVTVDESGGLIVTRSGVPLQVMGWAAGVIARAGDQVLLALVESPDAPVAVTVLARLTPTMTTDPDEGTVTAVNTTARTCTVTSGAATLVGVRYVGAAPTVGAVVLLEHRATSAYALGITAPAPAPAPEVLEPPIAPPPSNERTTGTLTLAPTGSGTFNLSRGSWSSYYGTDVMQGSYGGQSYAGAFVYGHAPTQLAGKTVTGAALTLGPLKRAGNYNQPRTLHVYRTALTSLDAAPTPIGPPVDVLARPITDPWWRGDRRIGSNAAPGLLALAQTLTEGGGLVIQGDPYTGLHGVSTPGSGLLTIDWSD